MVHKSTHTAADFNHQKDPEPFSIIQHVTCTLLYASAIKSIKMKIMQNHLMKKREGRKCSFPTVPQTIIEK